LFELHLRSDHAVITPAFSEKGSRSHFWAPVSRAGAGVVLNCDKSFVTSAAHADYHAVSSLAVDARGAADSTLRNTATATSRCALTKMSPALQPGLTRCSRWITTIRQNAGCSTWKACSVRRQLEGYGVLFDAVNDLDFSIRIDCGDLSACDGLPVLITRTLDKVQPGNILEVASRYEF
jgi:hypothetical protein